MPGMWLLMFTPWHQKENKEALNLCITKIWEREMGLISVKWGFLFGALPMNPKQRITFKGSSAVLSILYIGQGFTVLINTIYKIECCDWILIQSCNEFDNVMCQQTHMHTWHWYITLVNMLHSMMVP